MLGREEAQLLVRGRQECMLRNDPPSAVPPLPQVERRRSRWWDGLFAMRH
jgi:hypothetical protein